MSYNPAKVLGSDRGTLNQGAVADVTIIHPDKEYVIDAEAFVSKGKNTPLTDIRYAEQWNIPFLVEK